MGYLRSVVIGIAVIAMIILFSGSAFAETGSQAYQDNNPNKGGIMKSNDKIEGAAMYVLASLPYAQNALEPVIS
ncbi:MAG: hypothetical protein WC417_07995, partial [Candidatus Omnitrophota bacterium]